MMTAKRYYRTGEVAKLLGVAPRTVCRLFDRGELTGLRIPDSGDRRISHESLQEFRSRCSTHESNHALAVSGLLERLDKHIFCMMRAIPPVGDRGSTYDVLHEIVDEIGELNEVVFLIRQELGIETNTQLAGKAGACRA